MKNIGILEKGKRRTKNEKGTGKTKHKRPQQKRRHHDTCGWPPPPTTTTRCFWPPLRRHPRRPPRQCLCLLITLLFFLPPLSDSNSIPLPLTHTTAFGGFYLFPHISLAGSRPFSSWPFTQIDLFVFSLFTPFSPVARLLSCN